MRRTQLQPEESLLRNRRYALYLASRLTLIVATQMLSVAVGWQVYEITGQALALGFSGLALFLPAFVLALPAGHVADRVDRRRIILVCHCGVALSAGILGILAHQGTRSLVPIYALLAVLGTIRAFSGPAGQALMPSLVPRPMLERAISLGSSTWQLAMITGPSLGGALYAASHRASVVYVVAGTLAIVAFACVWAMGTTETDTVVGTRAPATWSTLGAGLRYVWSDKPILGSLTLDLFAVLLGGAVALLPIFAKDILAIGPWGLGILRSAPAIGAGLVAMSLAWSPLKRHAGITMFACVFLFGIATIIFGCSHRFAISLAALVILGGADMISVVIRTTLVQTRTPDEMRGRVSAVNLVFIGASNELGEFESGLTAAWLGPEVAVVVGGVGTCLVVLACALAFPQLRRIDRLDER